MFNPDKCKHIRITNKRKIVQTSFNIHGQTLKDTTQAKYPGVTIDNKLCRPGDKEGQPDNSFSP